VVYDAHEFWPHSLMEFRHWEVEFWSAFDRNLAQHADLRATVSPQLAELMGREYGCEFLSVPNCVSRGSVPEIDIEAALQRFAVREHVVFIFLGIFNVGRGIEDLIAAWRLVNRRALLVLQGPDNAFKAEMVELARSHGLLDDRVFFPPAVDTGELIAAARQADVGIIPYAASSINNRYCSPNKMSQYMAAGLPIIANETEFVKSVILESQIGTTVDFKDREAFAAMIDRLVSAPDAIIEMSRRAYRYFGENFNWEVASRDLYARIGAAVRERGIPARAPFDFSWAVEPVEPEPGSPASTAAMSSVSLQPIESLVPRTAHLSESYEREIRRLAEINELYRREIKRLNAILAPVRTATTPLRYVLRQWRRMKHPPTTRA
jgi:glycosyltransferase involved in cell wall biosynthesis